MEDRQLVFARRMEEFTPIAWEQISDLGLYMDQVVTFTQRQLASLFPVGERVLTPSMVNNYVKMGLVSRPVDKKYGRDQLAQILMVCMLKQSASAEEMKQLLAVPESGSVREVYEDFCQTQHEIFVELCAALPLKASMECAIRASAYRLLLSAVVGKEAPREAVASAAKDKGEVKK